jgi:antitoxin YefM
MSEAIVGTREFTRSMSKWLDKSSNDKMSIVVTRPKGEDVIVVPLSEYRSLEETAYLLQSPANAAHLLQGMQQVRDAVETGAQMGQAITNFDALWK